MSLPSGYEVVSLNEVSVSAAADTLASAFSHEGHPPSEWRTMLRRELESGRADGRVSKVVLAHRITSAMTTSAGAPRVVGVCIAHLGPEPCGHIGATGIRAPERGRRLGRALVEATLEGLDDARRTDVVLEVEKQNGAARALYESLGFRAGRELHTLLLSRSTLPGSDGILPPVVRLPMAEAVAAIAVLHPEQAAFQRRVEYLATFGEESVALGVAAPGGPRGVALQRGGALYDLAAAPEPDLVRALIQAALKTAPTLRLIHVADDDPLLPILLTLGATIATTVDELRSLRESW